MNSTKCAAHADGLSDVNAILTSNGRAYTLVGRCRGIFKNNLAVQIEST
jgi:hypothetical protein